MNLFSVEFIAWAFLFGLFWFFVGCVIGLIAAHCGQEKKEDPDGLVPLNKTPTSAFKK